MTPKQWLQSAQRAQDSGVQTAGDSRTTQRILTPAECRVLLQNHGL